MLFLRVGLLQSVLKFRDVMLLCLDVLNSQVEGPILFHISQTGNADAQAENPVDVHF